MKGNVVVAGESAYAWQLVTQLAEKTEGLFYYVLPDQQQAVEAGLLQGVIAVHGEMVDTMILDQLDLANCHTFVAASRDAAANILAALYAKNQGAHFAYARVFETKLVALLETLGILPIHTAQIAASFTLDAILGRID